MKVNGLFFIVFTLLFLAAASAQQLTVIQLNNRTADEIISTIKPFLKPNEGVSGKDYEIYLNAGPDTTQFVRSIITRIDKAPVQLMITVTSADGITNNDASVSVRGSIGNENARLNTGQNRNHNTLELGISDHSASTSERNAQHIRTAEGQPALIYSGTSVPIKVTDRRRNNGRIVERETYDYRSVRRGFYITAWLNGENVKLEVRQQNDSLNNNGLINVSGLNTVAHGKLGEWITVGGIDTWDTNSNQNIAAAGSRSSINANSIAVKVERID